MWFEFERTFAKIAQRAILHIVSRMDSKIDSSADGATSVLTTMGSNIIFLIFPKINIVLYILTD